MMTRKGFVTRLLTIHEVPPFLRFSQFILTGYRHSGSLLTELQNFLESIARWHNEKTKRVTVRQLVIWLSNHDQPEKPIFGAAHRWYWLVRICYFAAPHRWYWLVLSLLSNQYQQVPTMTNGEQQWYWLVMVGTC